MTNHFLEPVPSHSINKASIELVKKKVLEMFIFLNLALHSFSPGNFVPVVQIRQFQKCLIEENESYKMVHYT
jgi:hypothetical protein